ncbi:MAG: hypothetical protein JWO31_3613 [Phycisphaerales bacterium]|nr:hypothetical protein [Phycisphaerales bacterium]
MQQEERPHPRHAKASALHDERAAEREAERLRLIRQVEAAFDGVELGDGVSLHQARGMDDHASDAEVAAARALDAEGRWQDVSDEKLDRLSDTLPFMDAEGFRFYLPRFMLFALKHDEGPSTAGRGRPTPPSTGPTRASRRTRPGS